MDISTGIVASISVGRVQWLEIFGAQSEAVTRLNTISQPLSVGKSNHGMLLVIGGHSLLASQRVRYCDLHTSK